MKFVDRAAWLLAPLIIVLCVVYRFTGSGLVLVAGVVALVVGVAWLAVSQCERK